MTDDRWYCIELMLDGGVATPDASRAGGALDFWVDGAQMGPWNDLWMRSDDSLDVSLFRLNLFHHGDHSVEGIVFDNVVVSTERIGCPGR